MARTYLGQQTDTGLNVRKPRRMAKPIGQSAGGMKRKGINRSLQQAYMNSMAHKPLSGRASVRPIKPARPMFAKKVK